VSHLVTSDEGTLHKPTKLVLHFSDLFVIFYEFSKIRLKGFKEE
jgi:hypothetical protein